MLKIDDFLNDEERIKFFNYNLDICSLNQEYNKLKQYFKHKLRSDGELRKRKRMNSLKRKINDIEDIIYNLKIEKIIEMMFYYQKDLNENNIGIFNNDLLNIIDEYDFCKLNYLFYKQIDGESYNITSDIESIKTLLSEGWIEYIYIGDYKNIKNSDDIQTKCDKIFDRNTMEFLDRQGACRSAPRIPRGVGF